MIYLSGTYTQILPQYRSEFGYMLNANRAIGKESEAVRHVWALDNGAFSDRWREDVWLRRLEQLAQYQATCIGAVVPDVVGNHAATLERWYQYAPVTKAMGYKAAFATQDGATVDNVPWSEIDVLFVGGSDHHKRHACWPLIDMAKRMGLWVHVGRINSAEAIMRYRRADSVDGTTFRFEATRERIERILWAVRSCNARSHQEPLFTLA